jgi:hypothetical protein
VRNKDRVLRLGRLSVLVSFLQARYRPAMPDRDKLRPADPEDLAQSLAFAIKFDGRKRVHDADAFMATLVAQRPVRHLERCGYVVMKKPPLGGHSGLAPGPLDKG